MYKIDGLNIKMTEGDYGVILPIELETENEETFDVDDFFAMKIYDGLNTLPLITKIYEYSEFENDTIPFTLTQEETALLKVGNEYIYDIEWYQNDIFQCCIVEKKSYGITEKGGKVGDSN